MSKKKLTEYAVLAKVVGMDSDKTWIAQVDVDAKRPSHARGEACALVHKKFKEHEMGKVSVVVSDVFEVDNYELIDIDTGERVYPDYDLWVSADHLIEVLPEKSKSKAIALATSKPEDTSSDTDSVSKEAKKSTTSSSAATSKYVSHPCPFEGVIFDAIASDKVSVYDADNRVTKGESS